MVLLFTQLENSVKPGKVNTILIDNSAAPMLNFALAIWTKFYKSLSANEKKTNPTFCWGFFSAVWPTVDMYSTETVTEDASLLKGSPEWNFLKTLVSPFTCARTKTNVFEYNDAMHHLLLAQRMLRKGCHRISIDWRFRRDRRKRFQYATCH